MGQNNLVLVDTEDLKEMIHEAVVDAVNECLPADKTRSNQNTMANAQQHEQQAKPEPEIKEQVEEVAAKNVAQSRFHR